MVGSLCHHSLGQSLARVYMLCTGSPEQLGYDRVTLTSCCSCSCSDRRVRVVVRSGVALVEVLGSHDSE